MQLTPTTIPALLRRGAVTVAAGRVALGLTALAWPSVPARPWVGAAADDLAARVFGRALGARDVALGLGALAALQRPGPSPDQPLLGSPLAPVRRPGRGGQPGIVAGAATGDPVAVAASAGGAALTGAAAVLSSATSHVSPASS